MKKRMTSRGNILLTVFLLPFALFSQEWGGTKPNGFWDHWSVNANAGMTSYFGDLSYYDSDIGGKLSYESGAALGLLVTKYFNSKIGLSGELVYGHVAGGSGSNSFETDLFEYNVQASVDFLRIILSNPNPKFGIEGFAGLGHLWFKVSQYKLNEGMASSSRYQNNTPEFVYFAGMSIHYHIAEKFAITSSFSLRQLQNDRLDNLVKNSDYDFYSYTNIGVTYYFNSKLNYPMKNKARLAHSRIR